MPLTRLADRRSAVAHRAGTGTTDAGSTGAAGTDERGPGPTADDVIVRHELNAGFTWVDHAGPTRRLSAAEVAAFDEQGFVILEGLLDPETVDRVVAAIDPFEDELNELLRSVDGGKIFIARADEITFTTHLVTRSAVLRDLVSSPPLADVAHDLVGDQVRLYWDQAVYKRPGATSPFPWHQDNGYTFLEPQPYLTCWIALTDVGTENGGPWIVPGLHRAGTLRHELTDTGFVCLDEPDGAMPADAVAVEAPAGSVVCFSSLTPHCTGPNHTDAIRKAYIVQYAPEGAAALSTDPDGTVRRTPADDPDRQFPV